MNVRPWLGALCLGTLLWCVPSPGASCPSCSTSRPEGQTIAAPASPGSSRSLVATVLSTAVPLVLLAVALGDLRRWSRQPSSL